MKRSFKVSVVAAALALGGVVAHAAEKVTIQLKWVPQAQFAGYYVAQAKGFYKEAGLDVTIKAGGPDISPVQVIAGKSADVIVNWMPDALAAREAGVYLDTKLMQVFKGEGNHCRDRLFKDCCDSDSAGAGMSNQSTFGVGSRLVYDVLMNSENRQFVYQGLSALLTGAGFSGSFTSYGVTIAVNGTALPAGSTETKTPLVVQWIGRILAVDVM